MATDAESRTDNLPAKLSPSDWGKLGGAPKGNTNAVKTGLYAVKVGRQLRTRRVRRMVARLYATMPWLQESDLAAARGWAELEVIAAAVFADMMERGVTNEAGDPRRVLGDWKGLKQVQLAYERELGMTPGTRASMGLSAAQGQYFKQKLAESVADDHHQD